MSRFLPPTPTTSHHSSLPLACLAIETPFTLDNFHLRTQYIPQSTRRLIQACRTVEITLHRASLPRHRPRTDLRPHQRPVSTASLLLPLPNTAANPANSIWTRLKHFRLINPRTPSAKSATLSLVPRSSRAISKPDTESSPEVASKRSPLPFRGARSNISRYVSGIDPRMSRPGLRPAKRIDRGSHPNRKRAFRRC